ncbi:hypothetical protein J2T12_005064 [Paenibacillus anaericanus]|uniref:hypothetical protein n=1 Tax=Paenibacillus anaericanus TaxID=170367 RepID=UPI002783CF01|nr:hypothetical protein [Paenibacillus anaericanus]MDQ0091624.1 hypothetical protein [Paenibacillus anaericanus]
MSIPLDIRIKASDKPHAITALKLVGGWIKEGPHPRFVFNSAAQRIEYDRIRRRLEEEDEGLSGKRTTGLEATGGRSKGSVGRDCLNNNRVVYKAKAR